MIEQDQSSFKKRTGGTWMKLYLKGVAMGAADIVPGVSGGTIAFISGIYQELIYSLSACKPSALGIIFKQGFAAFWKHINGNFLVVLLAGIISSLLFLSKLVTWCLHTYPQVMWSFFFGLILASAWMLSKSLERTVLKNLPFLAIGFLFAWWLSGLVPTLVEPSLGYIFICGSIAICAMVLPGISGSFLLLLLGVYLPIITAISERELVVLAVFASGAIIGLLSFVHLLAWLLKHFQEFTFALLVGFLLGSLRMLWPWKRYITITAEGQHKSYGVNISPEAYQQLGVHSALELYCAVAAVVGMVLIIGSYRLSQRTAVH